MPGLPRNSTKKKFSKLIKMSGKSKTNTYSGATGINVNKISTKENKILNFNDFVNENNK